jgi:hydrogenase-4 component F
MLGALFHMVNHALSKSMLFLLSGSILLKYRTTEIRGVRGLLKAAPWTGVAFLCGTLALAGLPPFGLFFSEFIIFRAGFEAHSAAYAVTAIALLALVFAGMLGSVNRMLYGQVSEKVAPGDPFRWPMMPMGLNVILLVGFGVLLPDGIRAFFGHVLKVVGVLV